MARSWRRGGYRGKITAVPGDGPAQVWGGAGALGELASLQVRRRLRPIAVAAVTLLLGAAPAVAAPGDLDPSFSGDGFDIRDVFGRDTATDLTVQPDGKIVVVG